MAVSGIHTEVKATDPWRFVILLSRFTLSALQQGAVKSFGVLMPSLVLRLDSHYQTVGFILSMEYAVFMMTSPFVHLLSQRFEPRSIAVVGALLSSVCMMLTSAVRSVWVIGALFMAAGALSSPVFQTSHVLLHEYFNHRYAAANALGSTGAQAGGIVLPIVTSYVLIAYGVEGALLCLGVIFLNFVVIASLLRPIKVRVTGVEEDVIAVDTSCAVDNHHSRNIDIQGRDETAGLKQTGLIKGFLLRTVSWLADVTYFQTLRAEKVYCTLILPSVFLHQIAYIGWALFMIPYVHSFGMSPSREAYLPVTGAIGGFFGRLTAGGVLYLRPKWGKRTLVSGTIISSVGLLIFGLLHSHLSQFISTFFAGFGLFATFTSFYAILHDSVAKENFSGIIAFTSFIRGFGVATGGYVTGLIFEITGSFAVAFRVLACMDAAILILIFSFALIKKIN